MNASIHRRTYVHIEVLTFTYKHKSYTISGLKRIPDGICAESVHKNRSYISITKHSQVATYVQINWNFQNPKKMFTKLSHSFFDYEEKELYK